MAGILQEVYLADLQKKLYEELPYISRAVSHDAYVANNAVNIPQAGAAPNVVKNRSSLPATAAQRSDSNLQYFLNNYSTDPFVLSRVDAEDVQINYNKRQDLMGQSQSQILDVAAKDVFVAWSTGLPAGNIFRTTGANGTANAPAGATGGRKVIQTADFANAAKAFDLQSIPQAGRIAVMDTVMYYELFGEQLITDANRLGLATVPTGVVRQLYGFDIYIANTTPVFTANVGTVRGIDGQGLVASVGSTDCRSCIFYHPQMVARAMGSVELFERNNDPLFYGDVLSASAYVGGTRLRSDGKGIIAVVQAANA